ncbi:hypothetical protein G9A89_010704 [Geosiphon pyriformis]|nr:hypothetical protein G9A89_010704 [Geosiphon pyriformis]
MWHAARQQEKKIKEMMVDHKKRAERRRAYYDSRLGDPSQLLRLTGTARKLHPDAEQHFYHENPEKSLMTWQGDSETKIDRFDGRALLDFIPTHSTAMAQEIPSDERDIQEELNFERFRDLVENERRNVTEEDCLEEIEAEWTSLLDRHKALLKKLQEQKPENKFKVNYGFDYGTEKSEEDILDYVESLTDKDRHILNDMGRQYNIPDYTRLLRVAKRDRQEKANELKETEKVIYALRILSSQNESLVIPMGREKKDEEIEDLSLKGNFTCEFDKCVSKNNITLQIPLGSDSLTESSEGNKNNNDDSSGQNDGFVIQFGDPEDPPLHEPSVDGENDQPIGSAFIQISNQKFKTELSPRTRKTEPSSLATSSTSLPNTGVSVKQLHPRKLTPAEKLRLKTQMGLNKQIQVDEKKKIQKEQQMELERLTQEGISLKTPQPTTLDLSRTLSVSHLQSQSHEKERERSRSYSRSHSRSRSKRSRKRYSSSRSPSPSRLRGRSLTRNVFSPRRHHSPSLDETSMRKAKAKHPVNSRSSSPRKTQRNRNLSRSTSRQRSYRQPPEKRQRNRSHSRSLSRHIAQLRKAVAYDVRDRAHQVDIILIRVRNGLCLRLRFLCHHALLLEVDHIVPGEATIQVLLNLGQAIEPCPLSQSKEKLEESQKVPKNVLRSQNRPGGVVGVDSSIKESDNYF